MQHLITTIINYEDNLYILKRTLKEQYNPNIAVWKENLNADMVLRKEGLLYFLERIQEAQIIEAEEVTQDNPQ